MRYDDLLTLPDDGLRHELIGIPLEALFEMP